MNNKERIELFYISLGFYSLMHRLDQLRQPTETKKTRNLLVLKINLHSRIHSKITIIFFFYVVVSYLGSYCVGLRTTKMKKRKKPKFMYTHFPCDGVVFFLTLSTIHRQSFFFTHKIFILFVVVTK